MSPAPAIHGWCPGALRPMASGDGLVVRVRVPLGRLEPAQAGALAALAQAHGNGIIDLSARGNLQMRGVTAQSHPALLEGLAALGLLDDSAAAEARRNILLTPFWVAGDDSHRIAQDLTKALTLSTLTLPGKFGFAVDCGPRPVLRAASSDIRIERGQTGLICRADSAPEGVTVTPETAAETALALATWFLKSGGAPTGRGRMARHLARTPLPARFTGTALTQGAPAPAPGPCAAPGLPARSTLCALPFGRIQAETLAALATVPLRLTPWRMVLTEGPATASGLITDPADPRLRVTACPGAPDCVQALTATRALAEALAPMVPEGALWHVSGCAKGCAHPGTADVTLCATGPGRFDLIRAGRAADRAQENLDARAILAHPARLKGEPDAP